jgi:pimeloyl-ACP methyl ester carboxylesterase
VTPPSSTVDRRPGDPGSALPEAVSRRVRSTDGTLLAVREWGPDGAPTVVLVHGYPDTSELWHGVVERLAADHHVVAYDVRGAGASDRPRGVRGYRLEQLSRDLAAVLDATTDPGERVHLVGHDWGAIQSWESAASPTVAPRLASFTAVAGPSLDLTGHWVRRRLRLDGRAARQNARQLLHSWYIVAFHLPLLAPLAWRLGIGRAWARVFARSEGVAPPAGHPAPTITRDGIDGIALYRANMLSRVLRPRYGRVEVPLVQIGITLRDNFISPDLYEDLPDLVPELWVRRADAPHWMPVLDPGTVARWVREAVAAVEQGAPRPADAAAR